MTGTPSLIRLVEEASLNAWPAHQLVVDQGWVARFAGGYTRRSNSVNPLYAAPIECDSELTARIARCEAYYQARRQATVFKLTPLVQPPHLDDILAQRGYVLDGPTTVRLRSLSDPLPVHSETGTVRISEVISERWIEKFVSFSALSDRQVHALRGILSNIVPTTAYATLTVDGETVGCALAVLDGMLVGLYDVVTAPAARGRGYAVHLLGALLTWAKQRNAEMAYLAVMDDNLAARRLYDKLGFTELYPYWYRVQQL